MAMMFTNQDIHAIEAKAWREFKVAPLASGRNEETPATQRKRRQVSTEVYRGLQVLSSDNPPRSRDEAIERIVGVIGMMLQVFFPQYRLAIQVAGWLWELLHGESSTGSQA
jgi:hypothetical protein